MSEDVIARRARALEKLLGPAGGPEVAADGVMESAADESREAVAVARIGALLGHPGTWQPPAGPVTLPAALLAEIRDTQAATPEPQPALAEPQNATPDPEPVPVSVPDAEPAGSLAAATRRRWPKWTWTPPRLAIGVAGALAAVLLAVIMFGGDLLGREEGTSRQIAIIQLTGTSAAPDARGSMRVVERDAGWRLVVGVEGLAPAAPGEYYQGWAVRDREMVPLGTFHMHQPGQIELWSGVPLKSFSRIEVTRQRVGAGQLPGVLVLVGQL